MSALRNLSTLSIVFLICSLPLSAQTTSSITGVAVDCVNGNAGGFPCSNVELLSFLPNSNMAGPAVAEVWGWVDPVDGREYALVTHHSGINFVDVTDPSSPVYLGNLPTPDSGTSSAWRDVKTYQNHAYIVGDNAATHGLQIFDLTQLRSVASPPVTFASTALDTTDVKSAHNLAINEETGYAYIVGDSNACGNGLYMMDLSSPTVPVFSGCHNDGGVTSRGYVHDVQCVVYHGPDTTYSDREICFTSSESHITVVDVEDKNNPSLLASATYPTARYVHQGWLTDDHRYFIQGDELDELNGQTPNTKTIIWDVTDLDDPVVHKEYLATTTDIDHNLYVKGDLVFQANYTSGLRILNIKDIDNPVEVAYLDTVPGLCSSVFDGAWGAYPFLDSGNIIISSGGQGLFVVRPSATVLANENPDFLTESTGSVFPNPAAARATFQYRTDIAGTVRVELFDALGRNVKLVFDGHIPGGQSEFVIDTADLSSGPYFIRLSRDGTHTSYPVSVVN